MSRRIIVFHNQPIGIAETFVYNHIVGLKRYQPIVIGTKHLRGPGIDVSHLNIHLINQGGIIGTVREIGIKVLGYVPNDINRLIDQVQPHLIHAHYAMYGAVAMPLARQHGLPLLVSVHGDDVTMSDTSVWRSSHMAHRLYLLRRRALAQMVSRVIVQSDFLRRIVVERHGFAPERVVCIRLGVDIQRFNPNPQMTVSGKILYVGRLVELKGLPFLLQALARLRNRFPELQLTVIGDGPMRQPYEALGRDLLGQRVTFLGAQPNEVVQRHLAEACIFCMPSITMPSGVAESLGMVFLEAMAMQVPPVSFHVGGIPEVIIHGQTGFLARERDVEELAHYIEMLLANPDLRHRLGVQGRQWVEKEFNLEKQNARLESLYDEVVDEYHH